MGERHARKLAGMTATEVVAVADVREEVAAKVAADHGGVAYGAYEAMLERETLDLVVVATPDALHRVPVVACVEAGVPNLIIEKPLATTVEEAAVMWDAVQNAGVQAFVNFSQRFLPMDRIVNYSVRAGLIGEPVYGDVQVDDNISVPTAMWGERSREWAGASSTAHFLLSHMVDLFRHHFAPAEVEGVYAVSVRKVLGYCPDLFDGFLFFDNGVTVRVKAGWIHHIRELVECNLGINGTAGQVIQHRVPGFATQKAVRVTVDPEHFSWDELTDHQQRLAARGLFVDLVSEYETDTARRLLRHNLEWRELLYTFEQPKDSFDYFVTRITDPEAELEPSALPEATDGLRQTEVVCALIESAATKREVAVRRTR